MSLDHSAVCRRERVARSNETLHRTWVSFQPRPPEPKSVERFRGLTQAEQDLWLPLQERITGKGGYLVDPSGNLISTIYDWLKPHGVEGTQTVLELIRHLCSADELVKRSRKGVVLGIALPDYELTLDERLP